MKVQSAIRNWWPVLVFAAIAIATQSVFTSNVEANGQHAQDHLRSATAPFALAFFIVLIAWVAPKARRHVDVWVAAASLGVGAFLVLLGNLRVIHAIAGDAWTDEQANILGPARLGFASGHSLVELGERVTLAAVILLTVVLLLRRVIRLGPAIAAIVVTLVVPAHLVPGSGIFILAGDVCFQRARRVKDLRKTAAGPSSTSV